MVVEIPWSKLEEGMVLKSDIVGEDGEILHRSEKKISSDMLEELSLSDGTLVAIDIPEPESKYSEQEVESVKESILHKFTRSDTPVVTRLVSLCTRYKLKKQYLNSLNACNEL